MKTIRGLVILVGTGVLWVIAWVAVQHGAGVGSWEAMTWGVLAFIVVIFAAFFTLVAATDIGESVERRLGRHW